MWLIGWPPNRRIQYLKPESTGSEAPAGKWLKNWGRENYSPRAEEANALPRSLLPLSHTKWWVGKSFAIHSPHGSLSICHEWMSPRCQTPGSAVDAVLATWPVLVARHGCTDAEGNQQLWAMHPAWRQSYQSPNVTDHCYHTFGVATCWLYQHWDHDGAGSTPKCDETFGLLWPLYKTCHGICDPKSNCKKCY